MQSVKKTLRKEILTIRRGLSAESLRLESIKITEFLCAWPIFTKAETIMMFLSMPDEVETTALLEAALRAGKKVCIPLIGETQGQMQAVWLRSLTDLVIGKFGIKTVSIEKIQLVDPESIELILVPGVAFDAFGRRLGMGAGYYDRFLVKARQATLAGLALDCQLVENVPCEEYDQPVNYIATAEGIIDCVSLHNT